MVCKPDAEPDVAPPSPGQFAHLGDLGRRRLGWFAPGQIHVDVFGGDRQRGGRGSAEVDLRQRVRRLGHPGVLHGVVLAGEIDRLLRPDRIHDVQELAGAGVTLVVGQPVAEPVLFDVVAAGDDVEQHTALGEPLQRGGLLRGQRRRHQAGPECDEELQPFGLGEQCRCGQPGVLTPCAGRREHPFDSPIDLQHGRFQRDIAASGRGTRQESCGATTRATRPRSTGCRRWWAGTRRTWRT